MTSGTAEFCKNLFPRSGKRTGGTSAHPGFVLRGLHHFDGADHSRVLSTAVLRAEQVIASRLCRAEPCDRVTAGYNILLDAEFGNEEAVYDILRGQDQLDVTADWNME